MPVAALASASTRSAPRSRPSRGRGGGSRFGRGECVCLSAHEVLRSNVVSGLGAGCRRRCAASMTSEVRRRARPAGSGARARVGSARAPRCPRASRPALVLTVALYVLALAAGAHAASAPKVLGVAHVPLVAPAGTTISLTAKVRGGGALVGLVLGDAHGSATGGLALGAGVRVPGRKVRRVLLRGPVPATVALGELRTLLVCPTRPGPSPATARAGRPAKIATTGPSTEERLAGARLAGRVSSAQGVLLGLDALRAGSAVPAELRGDPRGPGGEQAAIKAAAAGFGKLPAAIRRKVLPYFVPPPVRGSAWHAPGRSRALGRASRRRPQRAARATTPSSWARRPEGGVPGWTGVPTSDGKAIVWYESATPGSLADRASAHAYARALPAIWKTLTRSSGSPSPMRRRRATTGRTGGWTCTSATACRTTTGRTGRSTSRSRSPTRRARRSAPTGRPSSSLDPAWARGRWPTSSCTCSSSRTGTSPAPSRSPGGTRAARRGPGTSSTRRTTTSSGTSRGWSPIRSTGGPGPQDYDAWPFWMMLQRTLGTDVLRSIFAQLRTKPSVPAVDAAISGGYAKQIPRFYLHVFNQSPVGDPGFEIPKSFAAWDGWKPDARDPCRDDARPRPASRRHADAADAERPRRVRRSASGAYHRVNIPDPKVKEIKFTNDLVDKAGGHVDAMLHMADGSWKLADWTGKKTVTLCRDLPGENVQRPGHRQHEHEPGRDPRVHPHPAGREWRALCPRASTAPGPASTRWPDQGTFKQTLDGTATLLRNPNFPPEADQLSSVPYDVQSASVVWNVTGSMGDGSSCPVTFSGSGTDTPVPGHSALTTTDLQLENVSGRAGAPNPEPRPFYYSIRSGINRSTPRNDADVRHHGLQRHHEGGHPRAAVRARQPEPVHAGRSRWRPSPRAPIHDCWRATASGRSRTARRSRSTTPGASRARARRRLRGPRTTSGLVR